MSFPNSSETNIMKPIVESFCWEVTCSNMSNYKVLNGKILHEDLTLWICCVWWIVLWLSFDLCYLLTAFTCTRILISIRILSYFDIFQPAFCCYGRTVYTFPCYLHPYLPIYLSTKDWKCPNWVFNTDQAYPSMWDFRYKLMLYFLKGIGNGTFLRNIKHKAGLSNIQLAQTSLHIFHFCQLPPPYPVSYHF